MNWQLTVSLLATEHQHNHNRKVVTNMKKTFLILALAFSLAGIGGCNKDGVKGEDSNKDKATQESNDNKDNKDKDNNNDKTDNENPDNNFEFKTKNIRIAIDAKAEDILEELGEPKDYFEAPSCAYQGLDKTYYYNGFEVTTYTDNNVDYIANILLVDDTVTTEEGVYIGSSKDDVVEAYGNDFKESTSLYTYIKGGSELQFIFQEDEVVSIIYLKTL